MLLSTFEDLRLELEKASGTLFLAPVTEDVYRSHSALSQSELKVIADRSPAHLKHQRRHPRNPTDSMRLGTASHCAILEPDAFEQRYAIIPKLDRRKKENRETIEALENEIKAAGKTVITEAEYETALSMRDALYAVPEISGSLSGGVAERACFGFSFGIHAKALLDYYRPATHEIIDLKSTRCGSVKQFERDVRTYRYHWQAVWYTALVEAITGEAPDYKIIAIENQEPFCSAVFSIKFDLLAIARVEIQAAVDTIKRCMDTGVWPGYPTAVNELGAWKHEWEAYKKGLREAVA